MRLFKVSATEGVGYDAYVSFIVIAETPEQAQEMTLWGKRGIYNWGDFEATKENTKVQEIFLETPEIIHSDFNAG